MLAANHSTYFWHDVKILQDLMPGEGVGAQCYGLGESSGKLMCLGGGGRGRVILILWFSFPFWLCVCVESVACLTP